MPQTVDLSATSPDFPHIKLCVFFRSFSFFRILIGSFSFREVIEIVAASELVSRDKFGKTHKAFDSWFFVNLHAFKCVHSDQTVCPITSLSPHEHPGEPLWDPGSCVAVSG